MKIPVMPKREFTALYSNWLASSDNSLSDEIKMKAKETLSKLTEDDLALQDMTEQAQEAIAYVTDTAFERTLETIQTLIGNVLAIFCIGELLHCYQKGELSKSKYIKIFTKYGILWLGLYLLPMLFADKL